MTSSKSKCNSKPSSLVSGVGLQNVARRTLGTILLLITVVLWTTSNFLASFMFADNSYSKPYFVTYINTAFFAISLIPMLFRSLHKYGLHHMRDCLSEHWQTCRHGYKSIKDRSTDQEEAEDAISPSISRLRVDDQAGPALSISEGLDSLEGMLNFTETAKLSLEFCGLWFAANYLVAACLEYTSVASSTILTSTSSIWTLAFGVIAHVEKFSFKKLLGVVASLSGIILISTVDLSGTDNDESRGKFPHKSHSEIALGDAMAFASAIMYGLYCVVMKKRIGNEDRVDMPLFFGMVGLFNVLFLWPGFFFLHFLGIETFELPPSGKIWTIILLNSLFSFVSDYCWAYAMLLTTPLVVTVGISMTIPLSLIGQMILSSQYSSSLYWIGALIVLFSFLLINHESKENEEV
ncbi:BgTH12-06993 [Blumeria graminis f. sp. triticale]|nr:BgTH12-06993 [Blumeria graminis f. sp. triticale]